MVIFLYYLCKTFSSSSQQLEHTDLPHKLTIKLVIENAGAEMYSLDDLPRVSSLNDEEVHSLDSELLDAEETHFTDTSDLDVSGSTGGRYRKHHRFGLSFKFNSK